MVLSLTLPTNGTGADVSTVTIPFGQIQTAYNNHISGSADQHDSTQVTDAALTELTTVTNAGSTTHARFDMIYIMLSAIMGGSGTATARYGSLPSSITAISTTLAAASSGTGTGTLVKRGSNQEISVGALNVFSVQTGATTVLIRSMAGQTIAPFIVQNPTGTTNLAYIDTAGNFITVGSVTAANFSGTLPTSGLSGTLLAAQEPAHTGDVTNTAGSLALTVALVGGTAAATIAAGAALANAAGSGLGVNTIVKRDGSNNFSAGTITATLNGVSTNVSGVVLPVNGGTGLATLTSGSIVVGAGTSNVTFLTAGLANNIIYATSPTAWTSGPMIANVIPNGLITLAHLGIGRAAATSPTPNTIINISATRFVNNLGVLKIVNAGTWNYDGSGGSHNVPTVGNERWDLFYYDNSGTLTVASNGNQAAGSATQIAVPTSGVGQVVCYVFLRASTTQILDSDDSTAAHGYIVDARELGGLSNATGTSSGVTYGLVLGVSGTSSVTLASQTGVTSPLNILDLLNGTATGTLNSVDVTTVRGFQGIRPAANKATLADLLRDTTSGQVLKSLVCSSNQVQMTVTNGPLAFSFSGDARVLTVAATSTTGGVGTNGVGTGSGSWGIWTICIDLTVAGPGFNITLVPPGTAIGVGAAPIATVLWDGSTFQQESLRYIIAPKIGSLDVALATVVMQPIGATLNATNVPTPNLNTYFPFPGSAQVTRYFSQAVRGVVHYTLTYAQPAAAIACYIGILLGLNGAAGVPAASQVVCGGVGVSQTLSLSGMLILDGSSQLGAGFYSFQPYVNVSSNTTNIATISSLQMHGIFYAV